MKFDGRAMTSLAMFAIFAGMSLLATDFPAKAGFLPLLVGVPAALLCFAQLIMDLRRTDPLAADAPTVAVPEPEEEPDPTANSEPVMFAWLGVFTAGLLAFGFIIGGPLLVFLYVRFCNHDPWKTALIAGAGTFAVLYGVFIWLLELTLFEGLLVEVLL